MAAALEAVQGALPPHPVGVVLGSGLGGFAARLSPRASVPFADLPGFPRCQVAGHAGLLHAGRVGGREVLVFEGRVHLHEGAPVRAVTFAVRLLAALAARAVVLTAATGAVHPDYRPGDLVLLRDQINLTGEDPARSVPLAARAVPFPSLHRVYHPDLLERLTGLAYGLGVPYHRGVLAGVRGPSYETPAEVVALRTLGADVVSMSVVLEAMVAAQRGLPVVGIGVVANRAGEAELSHERVLATVAGAADGLGRLLETAMGELDWATSNGSPPMRR